jgi:arylformamidase
MPSLKSFKSNAILPKDKKRFQYHLKSCKMKYIDITMIYEPGMRGVEIETAKTLSDDGWNAKTLHLYSHAGTHMDAPFHFGISDMTIDHINPERFFVSCYVVDLQNPPPYYEVKLADLGEIAQLVSKGEGLLFRSGWSKYASEKLYRDGLPAISKDLAEWCVTKGISFIGVEPPSVADVNNIDKLTEIHHILLGGDIIIVEGLAHLDKITQQKVQVVALPLKIKDGDGAPCRVIVLEQ